MIKPRQIFKVVINGKEYDVYDIKGKEHEGNNNSCKTWWLFFSHLPDGMIPDHDNQYLEPYTDSINRFNWEIKFFQINYSDSKWDSTSFRNITKCEMYCNNKLVYSFQTNGGKEGMSYAMAKSQFLQVKLIEHPYNFFETDKEKGRKIFYYGLPAKISVNSSETWNIGIIPCYESGLNKEEWWDEYIRRTSKINPIYLDDDEEMEDMDKEYILEYKQDDYINWGDVLEDRNIDWFRN